MPAKLGVAHPSARVPLHHHGDQTAPLICGRHSAAIVERIGVPETMTDSVDDYVSVAVLGRDPARRKEIQSRMESQKHRVYRDDSAITALEELRQKAAYGSPAADDANDRVR